MADTGHETNAPAAASFPLLERIAGSPRAVAACCAAYALVVTALGLFFHVMGDLESESDFFERYVVDARAFLHGGIAIDPYRGPVYPIVLALFSLPLKLFGAGLFETGIILSALSAGAVLYFTQRLLARVVEPEVALAAAALAGSNWVFVRYAYSAGTDMFFAAMIAATLYALLAPASTWRRAAAVGVLSGVTYLTRYNGVAIPLAAVAAVLAFNVWRLEWTRRLVACGVVLAGIAAVLVPWSLHCKAETGRFFYNDNYLNVAYGAYMTTEVTTERFLSTHEGAFNGFRDVIAYDPPQLLRRVRAHLIDHSVNAMRRVVSWPVSAFAIIGLVSLFFRRPRRGLAVYLFAAGVLYALLMLVFYSDRFVMPLVPPACALAALGAVAASELAARRLRVRGAAEFVFLVLASYSVITAFTYNKTRIAGGDPVFREMGEQFASAHPDARGRTVVARKAYFGYFAGLDTASLPLVETHEELMSYVRRVGADYVYFSFIAFNTRSALRYLAEPEEPHPGLRVLATAERDATGPFRAVLYAVEEETEEGGDASGE